MPEDKRLNEVIRIQKRKNNFVMMDKGFLENCNLSWKAKGILAYLLSKPDNWKVIVKDLINHSTDGKAAVYSGLAELKEHGHYQKIPVRDEKGKRISHWEGTISEVPMESLENTAFSLLTDFQEIENQEIENQEIENRPLVINDFSNIDSSENECECESAPAPITYNTYGEFQQVRMTTGQYDALIAAYGRDKATDYIARLDRHIASTGKRYKSHYATICKWIDEDGRKNSSSPAPPPKPNRFANFKQREWNFEQIAQMEQQNLLSGKECQP